MLQKIARLLIVSLLLIPLVSHAQEESFALQGWVTDKAQVLTVEQNQALTQNIATYEQTTTNEIAVLILQSLNNVPIENIAVETFNTNGIGKKGKDNGVLLVVALDDKKARIEVGYGLEGDLTDIESNIILRDSIFPFFKEGKYSEGISAGVTAIQQAIGTEMVDPMAEAATDENIFNIFMFLVIFFGSILASSRSIWLGGLVFGIGGSIMGFLKAGVLFAGLGFVGGFIFGLIFDFLVSRVPFITAIMHSMGRGGGKGGGFGGFGGGRSGGGGASGGW